jgi:hypothetical protein
VGFVVVAGFQLLPLVLPVGTHLPHVMVVEFFVVMVVLSSAGAFSVRMIVGSVVLTVCMVVVVVGAIAQAFPGPSSSSRSAHLRLEVLACFGLFGVVIVPAVVSLLAEELAGLLGTGLGIVCQGSCSLGS